MQRVPAGIYQQAQVGTAHTKCVDFTIQLLVHAGGFLHIAICADALDADGLAKQLDLHRLVALGRPQADADRTFHKNTPWLAEDLDGSMKFGNVCREFNQTGLSILRF